jgi:hypothetical protein
MLLKISSFCTTHESSVSTGFTKQIMPILRILCYNGRMHSEVFGLYYIALEQDTHRKHSLYRIRCSDMCFLSRYLAMDC